MPVTYQGPRRNRQDAVHFYYRMLKLAQVRGIRHLIKNTKVKFYYKYTFPGQSSPGGAFYEMNSKRIFLGSKDAWNKYTLGHEFGHFIWFEHLTHEERQVFEDWVLKNSMANIPTGQVAQLARTYQSSSGNEFVKALYRKPYWKPLSYAIHRAFNITFGDKIPAITVEQVMKAARSEGQWVFQYPVSHYCLPYPLWKGWIAAWEIFAEAFSSWFAGESLPVPLERQIEKVITPRQRFTTWTPESFTAFLTGYDYKLYDPGIHPPCKRDYSPFS